MSKAQCRRMILEAVSTVCVQGRVRQCAGSALRSQSMVIESLECRQMLSIPVAPTGLSVSNYYGPESLNVSWSDNSSDEAGFVVERATDAGFTLDLASTPLPANTTSYKADSLLSNVTYYFRAHAVNADGASANTDAGSATTYYIPVVPNAPSNLSTEAM